MNFTLLAQIILMTINAFGVILAWWVLRSGSKKNLKAWFLMMTLFMLLWLTLDSWHREPQVLKWHCFFIN